MKVLIVEDEPVASERLASQIKRCQQQAEITHIFDTVEDVVDFYQSGNSVDLAFFDIQLSDGSSFDIFKQVEVTNPVIFTTAYDEFSLKAFKVNSIDYLLKPIDTEELRQAFLQYDRYHTPKRADNHLVDSIFQRLQPAYKQRLLFKSGDYYHSRPVEEMAYFYAEGKVTYVQLFNGRKRYIIEHSLESLDQEILNPASFFRINRKFIIHVKTITQIKNYVNGRLIITTDPPCPLDMVVSREKVSDFKQWLNQ